MTFRSFYAAALAVILPTLSTTTFAKLVVQELNISQADVSPDCFMRPAFVINGGFPGPQIHVDAGDDLRIIVNNKLPKDHVSVHMHGLHQRETPFFDGAATFTQDPIPAGAQMVMNIKIGAHESGTHFYHAHHGFLEQSIFGALIVHDRTRDEKSMLNYDDEKVLLLNDWWHKDGDEMEKGLLGDPNKFIWVGDADSLLTNGKALYPGCFQGQAGSPRLPYVLSPLAEEQMRASPQIAQGLGEDTVVTGATIAPSGVETSASSASSRCGGDCAGLDVTEVVPGKTYRFRIINAGTLGYFGFAIAGHKMRIVETDGNLVEPFEVDHLEINAGQRYSVLVDADRKPRDYYMNQVVRWRGSGPANGQSILRYVGGSPQIDPKSHAIVEELPFIGNEVNGWIESQLRPLKSAETRVPEATRTIQLTGGQQKINGALKWVVNNVSFVTPRTALLRSAYEGVNLQTLPVESRPYKVNANEVVDLIVNNVAGLNGVCEEHPWHLHGQSFWVMGRGKGSYDAAKGKFENPYQRDTVTLFPDQGAYFEKPIAAGAACGWVHLRFEATNPGVWPFHCHIVSHFAMGMAVAFEQIIEKLPPLPSDYPVWSDSLTRKAGSGSSSSSASRLSPLSLFFLFTQFVFDAFS